MWDNLLTQQPYIGTLFHFLPKFSGMEDVSIVCWARMLGLYLCQLCICIAHQLYIYEVVSEMQANIVTYENVYIVYHSTASIINMTMKMAGVINSLPLSVDIYMFDGL